MEKFVDPFAPVSLVEETADRLPQEGNDFGLWRRQASLPSCHPVIARLFGFDHVERPLLSELPQLFGEIVAARTVVPLRRSSIGAEVVVLFEQGDPNRPIVMGLIQTSVASEALNGRSESQHASMRGDEERLVFTAEREIVLRCGEASISLTRAGKVIIKGNYILSRATGYNKIKGAAVDIN